MNYCVLTSTKILQGNATTISRLISTTPQVYLKQKWRKERGLPMNPNTCGILTEGADYTFLDGRLTPYGVGQQRRLIEQKEIADKIIQLSSEIDFAKQRHKSAQLDEEKRKREIISKKLKPKGVNLLKAK